MNLKNGFTLAEVLITLVVVGVIAALTIPTVIYETKKTEYSSKLKKIYSAMTQAELRAKADGKDWKIWMDANFAETGLEATKTFSDKYLLPYLSYSKVDYDKNGWDVTVYFNDGLLLNIAKMTCLDFRIDLNGDKKPNARGRDNYYFLYCSQNHSSFALRERFIPYQNGYYSRETALNLCKNSPQYCSALLSIDGWEYKDDYPHRL